MLLATFHLWLLCSSCPQFFNYLTFRISSRFTECGISCETSHMPAHCPFRRNSTPPCGARADPDLATASGSVSRMEGVGLKLTDEEAAALINLLTGIIETDRYPTSRRIQTLRRIRAKLPGIRAGRRRPRQSKPQPC